MGNSITHVIGHHRATESTATAATKHSNLHHNDEHYRLHADPDRKSKTLPARTSRRRSSAQQRHQQQQQKRTNTNPRRRQRPQPQPPNGETSRVLFLLYLIHRTWNVVVDTVDTRSKRSRRSDAHCANDAGKKKCKAATKLLHRNDEKNMDGDGGNFSVTLTDLDDLDIASSLGFSQYSICSCSYCYDITQNVYNSIGENCSIESICQNTLSRCNSLQGDNFSDAVFMRRRPALTDFSAYYQHGYQMAPSVCQNSPKLPTHNTATTTTSTTLKSAILNIGSGGDSGNGGAGTGVITISSGGGGGGMSSSSLTQKSNCGSNSLSGSIASYKMSSSENSWPQAAFNKENQRPPVYNPEDYAQSLKKFGKKQNGPNMRSIYDTSDTAAITNVASPLQTKAGDLITHKSSTLPHKYSEYRSPIPAPPESDSEMSLRQFASITDLLTKLRADLRVSFPSFVQEFIASPSDGVSLLLEVLRAIQLSQNTNAPIPIAQMTASMPRNAQSYQRRALLDELACLQCLSICCSRSVEAIARLGTTPVGLMPLASSATGQGIRARILSMQLMTAACDKNALGHGSQKIVAGGHTAVSEAMSTLRLRCSEPVRFRLLIGMLNSGGGSGELQAVGVRFINTFLESAENLQQRLYLQAELFQAGFEPSTLAKTISLSSPWLDTLRNELKRFYELYVDVDKMIMQARDADRVRSQMVILERRVQILHEEKTVLTSMERRLQERCAELQREIYRLQGAQNENTFKSLDKQPVALPRLVPPTEQSKEGSSEHEDEGISSSETGPSLSPVPILVLPQKSNASMTGQKYHRKGKPNKHQVKNGNANINADDGVDDDDDAGTTTIEHVMEELDNIVSEAEKQITSNNIKYKLVEANEKEIIPVNIVPQPPRKSRSLAHLVSQPGGSEMDGSEYGMLMVHRQQQGEPISTERMNALQTFFDEADYDMPPTDKAYAIEPTDIPEVNTNIMAYNASTTRELLDVIMNARHTDDDPTIKAFRDGGGGTANVTNAANKRNSYGGIGDTSIMPKKIQAPAQQFNGVFFMTGMNTPQKYPKPDLTAALQAKRVTKNVERLEAAFASHETLNDTGTAGVLVATTREKSRSNQQIYFGSNPTLRINGGYGSHLMNNTVTVVNNTTTRTRSYTQGSKVTDIPSGLY